MAYTRGSKGSGPMYYIGRGNGIHVLNEPLADKLLSSVACYNARSQKVESAISAICFPNAAAISTTHVRPLLKISNALYLGAALQTYLHCWRAA
jgi:hypothetical protein